MIRVFGKWLGRVLLVLVLVGGAAWALGPYEPVKVDVSFDPHKFGEGVQTYFESVEAQYDDITEGVQKRVIWANGVEEKTDVAVLYVHGFSATSQELRPVPDRVAEAYGANLVFSRLRGHGRPGAALGQATVQQWMQDTAEALAAARAVGKEVIVITTSTGGTLIAEAMLQPELAKAIKAVVFISPNFGINDGMSWMLTLPGARWFVPLLAGKERSWEPSNALTAKYWTTRYPMQAVLTLAALVKHARAQDYTQVSVPALFHFSDADKVVRAKETHAVARRWGQAHGGLATVVPVPDNADVVDNRHVIAGGIASPNNTEPTVRVILSWLKGL